MPELQSWVDSGYLSPESFQKLQRFANLIHTWNPKVNLTGFKSVAEIENSLIGECVAAIEALKPGPASVLDFGSGAGVPGLVWAVCQKSLRVTSVEVRQKKVAFQKEARRDLGLEVEILPGHFPEVVEGRRFDLIVSRAIRFDSPVWEQASALLSPGCKVVRFVTPGTAEAGWTELPVSAQTSLLIRST